MGRLAVSSTISLIFFATSILISQRLDRHRRIMPLRFSSPPRRRLEHGSEVHGHGRLIARSGARANTVPSSCVTPTHATSGDGPNIVIRDLLLRLTCNLSAPDIRRDEPCLPHRLVIMIRISANIEYVATPPPMEKRADAPAKHSLLVVYGMLLPSSQSNANCVHGMTPYDRWRRQQWTVTPSPIAHLPPKHRYSVGCPIYRH